MSTNETRLFCGVFVSALDLCIAAEGYTRLQRPLRTIKLIRRRIENGTIAFNDKGRRINVSQFSSSVWEKVVEELVDNRLGKAQSDIAKSVLLSHDQLDMGDELCGRRSSWWEVVSIFEHDWEDFVQETGGIMGIFKSYLQDIRRLLRTFGLAIPTTQNFNTETYVVDDFNPQIPVAFPFPSNTSKSSALLFKVSSAFDQNNYVAPVEKVVTIDQSLLTSTPSNINRRFHTLLRLYRITPSDESTEQVSAFAGADESGGGRERGCEREEIQIGSGTEGEKDRSG